MIQGVSWALYEDRILDRNVGTMVNPNLESYKILAPKDMFEAVPIADRGGQRRQQHLGRRHRRAADRADAGGDRQRRLQRQRRARAQPADHARQGAGGAGRSAERASSHEPLRAGARHHDRRQARALLAEKPGSVLKAGGIDLLDHLKEHLVEPPRVVDIKTIPALKAITVERRRRAAIGPLATLAQVAAHPGVREDAAGAGRRPAARRPRPRSATSPRSAATCCSGRAAGTTGSSRYQCLKKGGEVCYADRRREPLPRDLRRRTVLRAASVERGGRRSWRSDATFVLEGAKGKRSVPAAEFFTLPTRDPQRENELAADEVLTEIQVPVGERLRSVYDEVSASARPSTGRWSTSRPACSSTAGRCKDARIVLGAVAPIPWRVHRGGAGDRRASRSTRRRRRRPRARATVGAAPLSDNGYKVSLVQTLVRRTLLSLAERGPACRHLLHRTSPPTSPVCKRLRTKMYYVMGREHVDLRQCLAHRAVLVLRSPRP